MAIWRRIPVPVRGIDRSIIETEMDTRQGVSPWMENMLPIDGRLEVRRNDKATAITGVNFKELFEFGDEQGRQRLIGIAVDNQVYNITKDTNDVVQNVGAALGSVPGGGADKSAFMVTLGGSGLNRVYMVTGHRTSGTGTNIWNWNGTSLTQIEGGRRDDTDDDTDNPTPVYTRLDANCLLAYKGHLVAADIIEDTGSGNEFYPYRIRWAAILDPTDFVVRRTNSAGFVDLVEDRNNSRILSMVPLKEVVVIYKEDCIYNMTYKPIEQFTPIITATSRGALGPKAMAPVLDGNRHLVVSQDNIYLYNGFSFDTPPIGNPIRDWFFEELDWSKRDQVRVETFPQRYEAWISYPNEDGETRCIVWNWKYNGWFPQSMNYRTLYQATLFFDEPTFFGSYGDGGLHQVLEGPGVESGTYDVPLQRQEDTPYGSSMKFMVLKVVLDADGFRKGDNRWKAEVRSTDNLVPTATAYVDEMATPTGLRDEIGLRTIDFKRSVYRKFNGLRITSPAKAALESGENFPQLREVSVQLDIGGRR